MIQGRDSTNFAMTEPIAGRRRPPKFELIGGNVCLDFINTLDDRTSDKPKELLKNYYELVRFGEDTGVLTPGQLDFFFERAHLMTEEAEEALRHAISLREALYTVFSALIKKQTARQVALDTVNAYIHEAALHSHLVQRGERCDWRFDDLRSALEALLWPIARAAGDLLASSDMAQVRTCSSPTCQWFFLDTSKNHQRRWCSMKECGNRAKVRKFYARKKTA
jgi:predicted RNA-binding Zn ribbon-like protein